MELPSKVKNIVFVVEGGIGRNIAATAVVKSIKNVYPDKRIIVMAGCQEMFFYNPNVYKVFNFNNPLYFYDDYITDETYVIKSEPYLGYDYINKQSHMIQNWCDELGIENICKVPDLYFLENELEAAKIYVDNQTDIGKKEMVLLQWVGGMHPQDKTKQELKSSIAKMFRRALPVDTTQKLTDALIKKGYVVGVVGHENFPEIAGATKVFFPIRSTIALLQYVKTFIGIDSFVQHAAAASTLNKKGIVCWGGTSPTCLGYDMHVNLTKTACKQPFCHRPNSYLFDIQQHGAMWDCPYGEPCLKYTPEEILKVFEENFEEEVIKT